MPQAEPKHTFFVNRSLGGHVVADALKNAGEVVVVHDDVFEQNAADTTWLAEAGKRGWIVPQMKKTLRQWQKPKWSTLAVETHETRINRDR